MKGGSINNIMKKYLCFSGFAGNFEIIICVYKEYKRWIMQKEIEWQLKKNILLLKFCNRYFNY